MFLHTHKNVFTAERLADFKRKIIGHPNLIAQNENSRYVRNAIENHIPEADEFLPEVEAFVKTKYLKPLKFENSFCRTYLTGGWMAVHTDRPGLDVTVSFCLKKDTTAPWPLCISELEYRAYDIWDNHVDMSVFKEKYITADLEENEMCVMLGTTNAHWREELVCDAKQSITYVFFHWSFADAVVN